MDAKEKPQRLFPFHYEKQFLVAPGEVQSLLRQLEKHGFHETVSMTVSFDVREPKRGKWEIRFSAMNEEMLRALARRLPAIMEKAVWHAYSFNMPKNKEVVA